jgi:hypothetical protein
MSGKNFRSNLHATAFKLWKREHTHDARSVRFAQTAEVVANRDPNDAVPASAQLSRSAIRWLDALDAYETFWLDYGRTPRENTRDKAALPPVERRLGEWGRYQRRFVEKLCRFQVIRLDVSPAFVWDLHNAVWQKNFDACIHQFRVTGRLPYLNGADQVEFLLARWLGRQLTQYRIGALDTFRASQLALLLALRSGITW